eukprot:TRINITY_DN3692_c0_g1_i1.p1 TRINITY_DN3692_c0_g1~~TRINITY_DN3692_c0_g1_i1.p1  ORF type:complete len:395 (-),score=103.08 TRINITY_DN3692_c0_g1_i1:1007-2047(-)
MRNRISKSVFVALLSSSYFLTTVLSPSASDVQKTWPQVNLSVMFSLVPLGALVGCASFSVIFRLFKCCYTGCIVLADVLLITGCTVAATAVAPWMLNLGRTIAGLAVGLSSVLVPLYISFLCLPSETIRVRGRLLSVHQIVLAASQCFSYLLASSVIVLTPDGFYGSWRVTHAVFAVLVLLHLCLLYFVPVKPSEWEVLYRTNAVVDSVSPELAQELLKDDIGQRTFSRSNWHALAVGLGLWVGNQASGVNVMMYFFPFYVGQNFANGATTLLTAANVAFCALSATMLDVFGRRRVLMASCLPTFAALASLGIVFLVAPHTEHLNWLYMLLAVVFFMGFGAWGVRA